MAWLLGAAGGAGAAASRPVLERAGLVPLAVVFLLQSCAATTSPTLEELRNARISSIPGGPISLRDGVYEGPSSPPGSVSRRRVTLWT